jgi:chromosome segregation ATPase
MFKIWKQWQEDAALDSQIEKLLVLRRDEMITIHCLQWQVDRQRLELAKTQAALCKVKEKYHILDQELAEIDGRFSIVEMVKEEIKKTSSIKKQLKMQMK